MSLARSNNGCSMTSRFVDFDVAWLGPDGDLARMDARHSATCTSNASYSVSARMRFHARVDVTASAGVSNLRAVRDGGRVRLTWATPTSADLAGVIVRWYAATKAPAVPWSGATAYYGTGASTRFAASARRPVSVAVWAHDRTGNVSTRRAVTLP